MDQTSVPRLTINSDSWDGHNLACNWLHAMHGRGNDNIPWWLDKSTRWKCLCVSDCINVWQIPPWRRVFWGNNSRYLETPRGVTMGVARGTGVASSNIFGSKLQTDDILWIRLKFHFIIVIKAGLSDLLSQCSCELYIQPRTSTG